MDGPYREARPLDAIIPPDRRKQRAVLLGGGGLVAGAVLTLAARWLLDTGAPSVPSVEAVATSTYTPTVDEVERVVAAHRASVLEVCFLKSATPPAADVTVTVVLGPTGQVATANANGTDAVVATCVENQALTWEFPAHGARSLPVRIPFRFRRDG